MLSGSQFTSIVSTCVPTLILGWLSVAMSPTAPATPADLVAKAMSLKDLAAKAKSDAVAAKATSDAVAAKATSDALAATDARAAKAKAKSDALQAKDALASMETSDALGVQAQAKSAAIVAMSKSSPRSGTKQGAAATTVVVSLKVRLCEVSVGADSGWRSLDRNRVDELKAAFLQGEYGQNLLRKPSLLMYIGQPVLCADGLLKIADGNHTLSRPSRNCRPS